MIEIEMLDTVRFEGALALGFGGNEEAAMLRLRELLTQTLDPEEKGWVILYEATFLGRLHRVAEARDRVVDLRQLWQGVVEYDARIAVLEAFLDESEGERLRALTKLDAVLKKFGRTMESARDARSVRRGPVQPRQVARIRGSVVRCAAGFAGEPDVREAKGGRILL
jgi:hypothetical protein